MRYFNLLFVILLFSCSSRPKLYPNQKLKSEGKEASEAAIDRCMADAEEYLESSKGKKIAKGAGAGAIFGGAIGAVAGAFTGNFGGGVVRGGAVGAAAGGTSAALSPDQIKRNYTNQCLAEQGYRVIGWD